jgi:hypothetical protein
MNSKKLFLITDMNNRKLILITIILILSAPAWKVIALILALSLITALILMTREEKPEKWRQEPHALEQGKDGRKLTK